MRGKSVAALSLMLALVILITGLAACRKQQASVNPELPENTPVAPVYAFPLSLFYELRHSLNTASDWLLLGQQADGSWHSDPLVTAFVVNALSARPGYQRTAATEQLLAKGLGYLQALPEAAYSPSWAAPAHELTAAALLAFTASAGSEYRATIFKSRVSLSRTLDAVEEAYGPGKRQAAEQEPGSRPFGLKGLQLTLEALGTNAVSVTAVIATQPVAGSRTTFPDGSGPVPPWPDALAFITRCQSTAAGNAGGFRLLPAESPQTGLLYPVCGSMTYAGLTSLLDAGLPVTDSRVRKALDWVKTHYTLEEDPGLGKTNLYYYYLLLAKALSRTGENSLVDGTGRVRFWREELVDRLISLQKGEGCWEGEPAALLPAKSLTTAYAVLALKTALHGLKLKEIQ